jgi:hypothetical protein
MKPEELSQSVRDDKNIKDIQQSFTFLNYFDKFIMKTKRIKINETIFMTGAPRSGTSWLMEVLESISGYTFIFEPLNPIFFPEISKIGLLDNPYIKADKQWIELERYLERAFTGRIYSTMSPYNFKIIPITHRLLNNKLIVKSIRLNRALPWITNRFKLRSNILLIRHPCSVIVSQLKTGFCGYYADSPPYNNIFPTKKMILRDVEKIDIIDSTIYEKLKKIETKEEILATAWCLDYFVPLSSPRPYKWITVFYEKLVKEKESETIRILKEIGEEKLTKSMIKGLQKPSMLTLESEKQFVNNAEKQLSKWKKTLSEKQVKDILKILSIFNLDFYSQDIEPDYSCFK